MVEKGTIMTEKQFLRRLYVQLWLQTSSKEAAAVHAHYRRYFASSHGSARAELVAQCGSVELVVAEVLQGRAVSRMGWRIAAQGLLGVLAFVLLFLARGTLLQSIGGQGLVLLGVMLIAPALMGKGALLGDGFVSARTRKTLFAVTALGVLGLCFAMGALYRVDWVDSLPIMQVGPTVQGILYVIGAVCLLAAVAYSAMGCKLGHSTMPLCALVMVGACASAAFSYGLRRLSDLAHIGATIADILWQTSALAGMAFLVCLAVAAYRRRGVR